MADLYLLPVNEAVFLTEKYCRSNFPARTERSEKYKYRDDKLRCLGAGALLCGILGLKESEIICNEYGKPMAEGKHFSISHSGEYIILAVGDTEIGADIECTDRKYLDIANRVLRPDEMEWLKVQEEKAHEGKAFFRLWTLKEGVMKSCGRGLNMDPSGFSVLPLINGGYIETEGRRYYGETLDKGKYIISVCSEKKEQVSCRLVSVRDLLYKEA